MIDCKPAHAGRHCTRAIFSFLLALSGACPASAQERDAAPAMTELDQITVTGSRMKRVDQEDLQPLIVISREQLDASGRTSIAEVLRDLTQNSFGATTDRSPLGDSGATSVNLRGQGAQYTLVLLNGVPLVGDPSQSGGDIQNLNVLPWIAVDRIEILSDGASAIYGSKAIGGVINIITRNDFSGAAVSAQADHPFRGGAATRSASAIAGFRSERSRGTVSIDYSDSDPLFARDRRYLPPSQSLSGAPPTFRRDDPTGEASVAWQPAADCPTSLGSDPRYPHSQLGPRLADGSQFCLYDTTSAAQEIAALRRKTLLAQGSTALGGSLTAHALLLATVNTSRSELAPAPTGTLVDVIRPDSPFNPTRGEVGPGLGYPLDLTYRPISAGPRVSVADEQVQQLTAGLSGRRIAGWEADWSVDFTGTHYGQQVERRNFASVSRFIDAIARGDFNPFADPATQDFEQFRTTAYGRGSHRTKSISAQLQPATMSLRNISVSMLVGAEYEHENFSYRDDQASIDGDVFGWLGQAAGASRGHRALFGELAVNPGGRWEIKAAVRRDDYSDAGGAVSPKLAGLWRIGESLLLRASVGKGFHAPDFVSLSGAQSSYPGMYTDLLGCALRPQDPIACGEIPREVLTLPNPHLDPETARQTSIGAIYSPSRNFSAGVQGYETRLRNAITSIDADIVMQNDVACHAAGRACELYQQGVVERDSKGEIVRIIVPQSVNAATSIMRGFDVDLRAARDSDFGRFDAALSYSRLTHSESRFPGGVVSEPLGYLGQPRWRANVQLGWQQGDWRVAVNGRLIGEQYNCYAGSGPCASEVPRYAVADMQVAWKANEMATLTAGIRNIADREPFINASRTYGRGLYDVIGRTLYARLDLRLF